MSGAELMNQEVIVEKLIRPQLWRSSLLLNFIWTGTRILGPSSCVKNFAVHAVGSPNYILELKKDSLLTHDAVAIVRG